MKAIKLAIGLLPLMALCNVSEKSIARSGGCRVLDAPGGTVYEYLLKGEHVEKREAAKFGYDKVTISYGEGVNSVGYVARTCFNKERSVSDKK